MGSVVYPTSTCDSLQIKAQWLLKIMLKTGLPEDRIRVTVACGSVLVEFYIVFSAPEHKGEVHGGVVDEGAVEYFNVSILNRQYGAPVSQSIRDLAIKEEEKRNSLASSTIILIGVLCFTFITCCLMAFWCVRRMRQKNGASEQVVKGSKISRESQANFNGNMAVDISDTNCVSPRTTARLEKARASRYSTNSTSLGGIHVSTNRQMSTAGPMSTARQPSKIAMVPIRSSASYFATEIEEKNVIVGEVAVRLSEDALESAKKTNKTMRI